MSKKLELNLHTRAMKYLVRREHSRAELHAKLLLKATPDDNVDRILDELAARGWLSDSRAAEQLVRMRRNRFGMQRIAHELRQKGIGEDLINDALPQMKDTELEAARSIWQRKYGIVPEDAKEKAKQLRFMQSRGFMPDVIFKVLRGTDDGG
ncbi:MAG: recombination regulator RecX [Candidatus Nitrotoga sp.]|nr:recombination regulator RecX [Candidatus Nitrotoga sp.]MDO9448098.1 recombination regulator RecX [Candidatus Nitrotoga sp.]MDP3496483.1 recombination regulator RecX [Candidatus Nitrotoga sp.]